MFVGRKSYPSINHFINEANLIGVCKSLGTVPDIVPGRSRCFLLHRDGGKRPRCFGWFVIAEVTLLIDRKGFSGERPPYCPGVIYRDKGDFTKTLRRSGEMIPGNLYIISQDVIWTEEKDADGTILSGGLRLFDYPYPKLPANFPSFGGYRYIDGDAFVRTTLKQKGWPK